jgi:hypothetical protein
MSTSPPRSTEPFACKAPGLVNPSPLPRVGGGGVSHTDSSGIITFTGTAGVTYTINAP